MQLCSLSLTVTKTFITKINFPVFFNTNYPMQQQINFDIYSGQSSFNLYRRGSVVLFILGKPEWNFHKKYFMQKCESNNSFVTDIYLTEKDQRPNIFFLLIMHNFIYSSTCWHTGFAVFRWTVIIITFNINKEEFTKVYFIPKINFSHHLLSGHINITALSWPISSRMHKIKNK